MDITPIECKERIITFFDECSNSSVETVIQKIAQINIQDEEYRYKCLMWARDNNMPRTEVELTPIRLYISTSGGSCYDGLALYDAISTSQTPIEIHCMGRIMSMGVIIALASDVRIAYKHTTFMIHQTGGVALGKLKQLEDSIEEVHRVNDMLFDIIRNKTRITKEQLNQVIKYKKDWFITSEEALDLGIVTEIIE